MATVPLNAFKTVTATLTTSMTDVYTAPVGVSSIILTAQIANITTTAGSATFAHVAGSTVTELIKDYEIPAKDAASATTGKLVLESGQKIRVAADQNNKMKLTLSILESANE